MHYIQECSQLESEVHTQLQDQNKYLLSKSQFDLEFSAPKVLLIEWERCCTVTQCVWFVFLQLKILLEEVFLELVFILGKVFLRWNLIITLILTTKNNFTLFYPNKNYSFKLTFDILKSNTN